TLRRSREPLLELPVEGLRPGSISAAANARAMYRSIFHWRPLLNGYSSYFPVAFPARMALASRIARKPAPGGAAFDDAALAALRRETGLQTVVVRLAELGGPGRRRWLGFALHGGVGDLRLIAGNASELIFEVGQEAGDSTRTGKRSGVPPTASSLLPPICSTATSSSCSPGFAGARTP